MYDSNTMKKAVLSPLCSAFVIPGMGQVLNQHLKKGVFILGTIFVLFVAVIVKLYKIMNTIFISAKTDHRSSLSIMERIDADDVTVLWIILAAFTILWIYSVVDAFLMGRKIDRNGLDLSPGKVSEKV